MLVTKVESGQLADEAGLQVGDVLVRIGEQRIRNEGEIRVNLVRWDIREPLVVEVFRASETDTGPPPDTDYVYIGSPVAGVHIMSIEWEAGVGLIAERAGLLPRPVI